MSEADDVDRSPAESGEQLGMRMMVDVGTYLVARLLLAALPGVVIYVVGRVLVTDFPITVAVLFAVILAFPLGIWVFAPLRRKATASIALFDARRRHDRAQLQARLRGDDPST